MILKSERKVAQENILCYKFGDRNFFGTKLEMINRNYVYEKRKEQDQVTIIVRKGLDYRSYVSGYIPKILEITEEGYHSYISTRDIRNQHLPVELFIIPKGTIYYEGGVNNEYVTNGYVSENIVWIGKNTPKNREKARLWKPKVKKNDQGDINYGELIKQREHSSESVGV